MATRHDSHFAFPPLCKHSIFQKSAKLFDCSITEVIICCFAKDAKVEFSLKAHSL